MIVLEEASSFFLVLETKVKMASFLSTCSRNPFLLSSSRFRKSSRFLRFKTSQSSLIVIHVPILNYCIGQVMDTVPTAVWCFRYGLWFLSAARFGEAFVLIVVTLRPHALTAFKFPGMQTHGSKTGK
jgi:hypothetical protein